MKPNNICPICGYPNLDEPPYDKYGDPSYEICACCGFEYGFDDHSEGYTFESYRKEWMNKGYPFKWKDDMPEGWNAKMAQEQLLNLQLN